MIALIIIFLTGLITLFSAFTKKSKLVGSVATIGLVIGLFGLLYEYNSGIDILPDYDGFQLTRMAALFSGISIVFTLLFIWVGFKPLTKQVEHAGEHISLMIFSLCGAVVMTGFTDFFMFFIGLEILSIPVYVLAGMERYNKLSSEAAIKYFLTGAFSTGVLLFGIAWVYGATGSFDLMEIKTVIMEGNAAGTLLDVGMLLILASFLFKVSSVPFHFWSPDVYAGSPMTVMGYMSSVIKIAGFAAILNVFTGAFADLFGIWGPLLTIVCVLSMFVGNLSAIKQTKVRRMLAYSSIAHAGYTLLAIISFQTVSGDTAAFNVWYYLVAYSLSMVVLITVGNIVDDEKDDINNWIGIARRFPILGVAIFVALFSLAGIPPTMGFFGKYLVFGQAIGEYPVIVGLALLNSGIAVYYYLMLAIKALKKPDTAEIAVEGEGDVLTATGKLVKVNGLQWAVIIACTTLILISGFIV